MKLTKRLTLLLVPDSSSESRQVSISMVAIYAGAMAIILVFLAALYFTSAFFGSQVDQTELDRLKQENTQLSTKFEDLSRKLEEADSRYQEIVKKEIALRALFQLPEIGSEHRFLGIGGPDEGNTSDLTSDRDANLYSTEASVDRLLELSSFEIERFEELETRLQTIKEKLDHTPCVLPAQGWFSRGFGIKFDPFTGGTQMHRGIDIAAKTGTPIIAPAAGVVSEATRETGLGLYVELNHGNGLITKYGHLSGFNVKKGQRVSRGQVIGFMGSTGRSTGPHLHYEVWRNGRAVNPMEFVLSGI